MRGKHAAAVGLLLCDARHRDGAHHLFGSWAGDPIVVTGDNSVPNTAGVRTSSESDPAQNLYKLAYGEFEDISMEAMLMLIADDENWADEFARSIEPYNSSFLIELVQLVFRHNCEPMRKALERNLGPDWTRRYKEVAEQSRGRRYTISKNNWRYRLEVADLRGVPDLTAELKKANPGAAVQFYLTNADASESQGIMLGTIVPPEIAVKAIQLAVKHWTFLRYVRLSSDQEKPPEVIHDEINFGNRSGNKPRKLREWSESDFNGLSASMSLSQLHEYVRSRYL